MKNLSSSIWYVRIIFLIKSGFSLFPLYNVFRDGHRVRGRVLVARIYINDLWPSDITPHGIRGFRYL